jgi:hypothetical protein
VTAEFWIRKKNTGNKIAPATAKWLEFIGANEWNWLNVTSCRKVLLKCLAHLKYLYKICCCLGREFIFTTMRYFLRTWLENIAPQSTLWSHLSVYSYFAKSVSRRNFDTECSRICLAEKNLTTRSAFPVFNVYTQNWFFATHDQSALIFRSRGNLTCVEKTYSINIYYRFSKHSYHLIDVGLNFRIQPRQEQ